MPPYRNPYTGQAVSEVNVAESHHALEGMKIIGTFPEFFLLQEVCTSILITYYVYMCSTMLRRSLYIQSYRLLQNECSRKQIKFNTSLPYVSKRMPSLSMFMIPNSLFFSVFLCFCETQMQLINVNKMYFILPVLNLGLPARLEHHLCAIILRTFTKILPDMNFLA
jgi:hypothetical protein